MSWVLTGAQKGCDWQVRAGGGLGYTWLWETEGRVRHTQELLPPVIGPWDRQLAWEAGDLAPTGRPAATVCSSESPFPLRGSVAGNMSLFQEDPDPQDGNKGPQHPSGGREDSKSAWPPAAIHCPPETCAPDRANHPSCQERPGRLNIITLPSVQFAKIKGIPLRILRPTLPCPQTTAQPQGLIS